MTLASACQFNALSQSTLHRTVSRSVRYEEEVGGNGSWAAVTMFLCPGEIVASFSVELDLGTEAASRDHTQVTASVLGDISNETVEDTGARSVDSGYKSVFIQYLSLLQGELHDEHCGAGALLRQQRLLRHRHRRVQVRGRGNITLAAKVYCDLQNKPRHG